MDSELKADRLRQDLATCGWLLVMCAGLIGWMADSGWGWFAAAWIAACGVNAMVGK